MQKTEYNKLYNSHHNPFPVRLGTLKEIIMEDAFDSDQSIHWCIMKALEVFYAKQLIEKAKKANDRFPEVLELVKIGYSLKEALHRLWIPDKLLILGIDESQRKEIYKYLSVNEIQSINQKVGYYAHLLNGDGPVNFNLVKKSRQIRRKENSMQFNLFG